MYIHTYLHTYIRKRIRSDGVTNNIEPLSASNKKSKEELLLHTFMLNRNISASVGRDDLHLPAKLSPSDDPKSYQWSSVFTL